MITKHNTVVVSLTFNVIVKKFSMNTTSKVSFYANRSVTVMILCRQKIKSINNVDRKGLEPTLQL